MSSLHTYTTRIMETHSNSNESKATWPGENADASMWASQRTEGHPKLHHEYLSNRTQTEGNPAEPTVLVSTQTNVPPQLG